jgi:energy-coupling factor transporter transmembrane protein EcfT
MDKLTKFLGGVALWIAVVILHGWVLTYLWKWFIVPLGVVKIGVAWAIGVIRHILGEIAGCCLCPTTSPFIGLRRPPIYVRG